MKRRKIPFLILALIFMVSVFPVTNVAAAEIKASQIDWYIVDHTNFSATVDPSSRNYDASSPESYTAKKLIAFFDDPEDDYYSVDEGLFQHRHIRISDDGTSITFSGYGTNGFHDFLFNPNSTAEEKTFKFAIDEEAASYHTLQYAGFLFNTKYDAGSNPRTLTGYFVGVGYSTIDLFKLENVNVNKLNDPALFSHVTLDYMSVGGSDQGFTKLASVDKSLFPTTSVGESDMRYLKIVATPSNLKVYQYADADHTTPSGATDVVMDEDIDDISDSYGFGPYAAYNSHWCSEVTWIDFLDLTFYSPTLVASDEVEDVKEPLGRHEVVTLQTNPLDTSGVKTENINYCLATPEIWSPSVKNITVWLETEVFDLKTAQAFAKLAPGQMLLKDYNIRLMMKIVWNDGTVEVREVDNADIKKNIPVLIPIDEFAGQGELGIVYIDTDGNTAILPVTPVTLDGKNYLRFENNHFSQYGVISGTGTTASANTYVIQLGDTLSSIAFKFGVSVQSLVAANNISNPDLIFAGKTLIIA